MPIPTVTDEEFITIWRAEKTPLKVAQLLGVHARSVQARRRRIEQRLGIHLPTHSEHPGVRPMDYAPLNIVKREIDEFVSVNVDHGVIIVASDCHYSPGVVPVAHNGLLHVINTIPNLRAMILNGDVFNGASNSRHAPNGWESVPNVKQELEAVSERLHEIKQACRGDVATLRTRGNHDDRYERKLAASVPEYAGVAGFCLADHLPGWLQARRIHINDDTVCFHDWHFGIHAAHNNVLKSGGYTVITGHTHKLRATPHRGFGKVHYGVETGMLADIDQTEFLYVGARPKQDWVSGFAVLTWADGELLYPEFAEVKDNGKCYFRGEQIA